MDGAERTELVSTGPFALVRNPIFSAMVPALLGRALLVPNVAALAGITALVAARDPGSARRGAAPAQDAWRLLRLADRTVRAGCLALEDRRDYRGAEFTLRPLLDADYNESALLPLRCTYLTFALAILVTVFVSFHPYFDVAGLCGLGGCPEPSQSSSPTAHSTGCVAAVLVASGAAALAFASFFGRLRAADHRRPAETYLSPDTPPPRVLFSR